MIDAARHEDADVDAVSRRAVERLDFRRGWREVRRRDPDRSLRRDRLDLQCARDAEAKRLTFDDADERWLIRGRIQVRAARLPSEETMRPASFLAARSAPHAVERLQQ